MTLEELHRTVVDGFRRIDERFTAGEKQNDQRFAASDRQFAAIDQRFAAIDQRFDAIDRRFEVVEARIREEGETTRRHFEVMVEKIEASVRIVAEGHGNLRTVVDDHEVRLQAIEKRG